MNKFKQRFAETLKANGMTQSELARRLKLPFKNVNNWYLGVCEPNFDTLMQICRELNESADYLLGLTD